MSKDAYTHYVVLNETILGEARIIEKCNEWISLAFVKLGIGGAKPFSDYAFVEKRALVPKTLNCIHTHPTHAHSIQLSSQPSPHDRWRPFVAVCRAGPK